MKIDFHTRYNAETFESLCESALSTGLDSLVMSGFDDNKPKKFKSLTIFSAQEITWSAVLEIPFYRSYKDFQNNKKEKDFIRTFEGNSLVLLPQNEYFLDIESYPLYEMFNIVSKKRGITVSLHDDT